MSTPQVPARRTMALKTVNDIVMARSRMIGEQTGISTQAALASAQGAFAVVRPGVVPNYVAARGGWTTDATQALTWSNTADLLRACYKLNVSGLRIVNAPTLEDIAAGQKVIADASASRAAALAKRESGANAKRAAITASRQAAGLLTSPKP